MADLTYSMEAFVAQVQAPFPVTEQVASAQVISPSEVMDQAAINMVVADARRTKSWLDSRYFNIRWIELDLLYQSPPQIKVWEGTQIPRANISKFTVATHINAINSKLVGGIFYEEPAFKLRPRPGTTLDTVRGIESLFSYQLDEMNFKQEIKYGFFSTLLNGTGIWKWGWKEYYEDYTDFQPLEKPKEIKDAMGASIFYDTDQSDIFSMTFRKRLCARPFIENCDIRQVLVDPGCRTPDVRDAKFVIHEFAVTYKDLIRKKNETYLDAATGKIKHRYDLPSEEVIRSWFERPSAANSLAPITPGLNASNNANFIQHAAPLFQKTTEDPLEEPLELLERWDNDKVITVLQQRKVIRNEPNPFRCIPFFSLCWWMIQDCFWGIGLGTALGGEQRLQQGFINAVADIGTLSANQPIVRSRGANINTQQVRARLGGFIDVDGDATKALHPMDLPKIQGELFTIVAASEARTEESSGANSIFTMGGSSSRGKGGPMRTATGAGGLIQAAQDRLGGLAEDFNRQVYQPFLWKMYEMNKMFLPASVYRQVLGDRLGKSYRASIQDFMASGMMKFEILAGSHLAAKQQMAQSLPLIMQYFMQPALADSVADINGEYIDYAELLHMLTDSSGWGGGSYYSIFKPLTPEMKQRREAKLNPAAMKAQATSQLQNEKFQQKATLQSQAWTERAAGDIIRHSLESAGSPEAITGQPGGPGFGGTDLTG